MKILLRIVFPALFIFTFRCATISSFDQYAYAQTTSLKVDALNIMDSASENYSLHKNSIDAINLKMQKAFEYEKHRPKNTISASMWKLMLDTNKHLYGGFMKRWKNENQLDTAFIADAKKTVSENFDRISELESKKLNH